MLASYNKQKEFQSNFFMRTLCKAKYSAASNNWLAEPHHITPHHILNHTTNKMNPNNFFTRTLCTKLKHQEGSAWSLLMLTDDPSKGKMNVLEITL
jgi:hypothetical protein